MNYGRVGHSDDDKKRLLECEALSYVLAVSQSGRIWWHEKKNRLIQKRGISAVENLIHEMERQRFKR